MAYTAEVAATDMTEFIKMDIFFFVTTIVVMVAGVLLCVSLYYVARILRNVEKVSESIEEETRLVREDIHTARQTLRMQGFTLGSVASAFRKLFSRFSSKSRKGSR